MILMVSTLIQRNPCISEEYYHTVVKLAPNKRIIERKRAIILSVMR